MAASQVDYFAVAEKRWPRAVWVLGDNGPFATLAHCGGNLSVMLHTTRPKAEQAKADIDRMGCGGGCRGRLGHEIVELAAEAGSKR